MNEPVAELVLEQMAVGDASSLRVKWLIEDYPPVGTKLYTHPVKELNDGGEPVKNATYWKRQYNLMATQNDNLKSGLYHANEQIKYLESRPVKEQRRIDVLMELAKYRLLSKDEIAELAILRKASEK